MTVTGTAAHRRGAAAIGVAVGVGLFAWTLSRIGLSATLGGVVRLGIPGFLIVLVLSGTRLAARALAWTRCFPPSSPLRFRDAFAATLMADALGNVTPFATFVSEPAKAVLVRNRVPLAVGLEAIVIENVFYTASMALMIAAGAVALVALFEPGTVLRWTGYSVVAAMGAVLIVVLALLTGGFRPITTAIDWLRCRGLALRWLTRAEPRIASVEVAVNQFCSTQPVRLLPLLLAEACFHVAGVAEVYVTLRFASGALATSIVGAIVLESAGRVINLAFEFIPLRLGVDEAGAAGLAAVLHLGAAAGVTLALVRKARLLTWTAVGLLLLPARGLSRRAVNIEAQSAYSRRVRM